MYAEGMFSNLKLVYNRLFFWFDIVFSDFAFYLRLVNN